MEQETRFQMRCDAEFLRQLDFLKRRFGVRTRPEIVRMVVKRVYVEEILQKKKDKK